MFSHLKTLVSSLIKCFKSIISQVGFPDSVLTDQGLQLENLDFCNFLKSFNIKKCPNTNGIVERFNGTFKKAMLSYVTDQNLGINRWKDSIDHCLLDFRTTPHSATDTRPVDLFFAFNVRGYIPSSDENKSKALSNDFAYKYKTKKFLDRKSVDRVFPVGSSVLVKDFRGGKFSIHGRLAEIIKQFDNHSVLLRDTATSRIFKSSTARISLVPNHKNYW